MSGLSRAVLKWIQKLSLTYEIRHPRSDLSNGFIIAEILSKYYPKEDVKLFAFVNEHNRECHYENWKRIRVLLAKYAIPIDEILQVQTMQKYPGAAQQLLEEMYAFIHKDTNVIIPNIDHIKERVFYYEAPTEAPRFHQPTAARLARAVPEIEMEKCKDILKSSKKFEHLVNSWERQLYCGHQSHRKSHVKTLKNWSDLPEIEAERTRRLRSPTTDMEPTMQKAHGLYNIY